MMNRNIIIFAIVAVFATLCVTFVSYIAINKGATWTSPGIIIGIVCATITIIAPLADFIRLRFRQKEGEGTEVDLTIKKEHTTSSLNDQAVPLFSKEEIDNNKTFQESLLSKLNGLSLEESGKIRDIFKKIEEYIVADQIPESGGWGISLQNGFEYTYEIKQSLLDKREGSIAGTYMAIRALAARSVPFNHHSKIKMNVVKYLVDRQTANGSFGRFSVSRSGEEIIPSCRHAGFAVMALMLLDGPPDKILKGLKYVTSVTSDDVIKDAATPIAIGSILLCCRWALTMDWGKEHRVNAGISGNLKWLHSG